MSMLRSASMVKRKAGVQLGSFALTTTAVGVVHSISAAVADADLIKAKRQLKSTSYAVNRAASLLVKKRRGEVQIDGATSALADAVNLACRQGLLGMVTATVGALFTAFARVTSLVVGSIFTVFRKAVVMVVRAAATNPVVLGTLGALSAAAVAYYGYRKYREHKILKPADEPEFAPGFEPKGGPAEPATQEHREIGKGSAVKDIVLAAAKRHGIPGELALRVAYAESSLRPDAKAKTSTAKGLFQFLDSTWAQLGGTPGNQFDPHENAELGAKYLSSHYRALSGVLKRPVRYSDVYAMHFFGPGVKRMLAGAEDSWPIEKGLALVSNRGSYVQSVLNANPYLKGKTVGDVHTWLGKKVGSDEIGSGSSSAQAIPSPSPIPTGSFMIPAAGRFSSGYGVRTHPVKKTANTMHHGIDIAAPMGTPIYAADSGKVTIANANARGYGTLLVIDHGGGLTSRYGHSRKLLVSVGQAVLKGQKVAEVGSEGWSTGPHLHFEIRRGEQSVDPATKIAGLPSVGRSMSTETVLSSANLPESTPIFAKTAQGQIIRM